MQQLQQQQQHYNCLVQQQQQQQPLHKFKNKTEKKNVSYKYNQKNYRQC